MQAKIVPGYEGGIAIGQRQLWEMYGTGPAVYKQATTDVISVPSGMYIDDVGVCFDTTHTYVAIPWPNATGTTRATWAFRWFTAAGMTEVADNSTALAAIKVQFKVLGGEF